MAGWFVFLLVLSWIPITNAEAASALTIRSPEDGEVVQGNKIRISGTYTETSSIQLIINAEDTVEVIMNPENQNSGTWYYDLNTSRYNGSLELLAIGTNTSTRYTVWSNRVHLNAHNSQAAAPVVTIISPEDSGQMKKNNVKIEVKAASENQLKRVEVRINGGHWKAAKEKKGLYEYKWKIKRHKLKDQTFSLEARATDTIGTTGLSSTSYVQLGKGSNEETSLLNQDRAMWIWENASYNLLYNKGSRKVLDAMAKDTKTFDQDPITTLYLGVGDYFGTDMLEDEREKVRDLVHWAHDHGYKIQALMSGGTKPPYFGAYQEYHHVAIREFENILNYNLSSKKQERFDGVNIDIEPYIAPEFKTDTPSLQLQYLDLLQIFMDRKKAAGSGLSVGAAIPRWYDSSDFAKGIIWGAPGKEKNQWLSQHVQDIVDYISIMDYRDQAEGSAGIIAQAQGEIDYANEIGKPNSVVIGVETKDIADGGDPEVISFREEGRTYMEEELKKVESAFSGEESYAGIALHHYDTIRYLPSEWSPDAVFWKPPEDSKPPTQISKPLRADPFDYQSVTLSYGRAFDNQEIEEYRIYRSTDPAFQASKDTFAGASRSLEFTDTGLLPNTTYFYKVAAVDVTGNTGPLSSMVSAATTSTDLLPMIINDASIVFDGTKATVNVNIVDLKNHHGLSAALGGRFTRLSGKYMTTNTNPSGHTEFSSEEFSNEKGQIGFKVNTLRKEGYYWASAYDQKGELLTEWDKQTIPVSEDAFIRSGNFADLNYGTEPLLEIKDVDDHKSTNYDRAALLKFDFSSLPINKINQASLHFYVNQEVTDAAVPKVPVSITGLLDDYWSERTVNWNNQPAQSENDSYIGQLNITHKGWYSINISDYVKEQLPDKTLTIRLEDQNGTDRSVFVHSKDNLYPAYIDVY